MPNKDRPEFSALTPIYDATTDPRRWLEALDAVADTVGAQAVALLVISRETPGFELFGLSSVYLEMQLNGQIQQFMDDYRKYELPDWQDVDRRPVLEPIADTALDIPREVRDVRPDYRFLRAKAGVGRRVVARLNENRAWFDAVACGFDADLPDIPATAADRLTPLLPHLAKSAELARTFQKLRSMYNAVLTMLDHIHVGLAIALPTGEIIVRNAEADRILSLSDGISRGRDNRFILRDADQTAELREGIAQACRTGRGLGTTSSIQMDLARPSGQKKFLIEIAPLNDSAGELEVDLQGALITIIDPENSPRLDVAKFSQICDLTRAETDVCKLMVEGYSGAAIANERGTSPETVKTQMSNVMYKAGARGRTDLIRMVVRTLPPIG